MDLEQLAHALRNTALFTAVRESALVYPVILATHLTCLAFFGGMILATNLRLLGVAFGSIPAGEMVRTLRPWKRAGLVLMAACGILLAGSRADTYYPNTYFRLKLFLLLLLSIHAIVFRSVYRDTDRLVSEQPSKVKWAGGLSLLLWLGVACAGRWIAYYDSPKAIF